MTSPSGELASPPRDGGIVRLNPRDGLFLRSVHLNRMQDYARELALSVGMAGGAGVVHGYGISVVDAEGAGGKAGAKRLRIEKGLAVAPSGRPLRCLETAYVELTKKPRENHFYVVEVQPKGIERGPEPVYGALCDDPCSGQSTIRSELSEGVEIVLRPDRIVLRDEKELDAQERRRAWLAKAYFHRERERAGSWLDPASTGTPLERFSWVEPDAAPEGDAVPLAVLQWDGKDWLPDVWTARRDRTDPPPRSLWLGRLGMRPWNVFIAQVLQFQDQLADELGSEYTTFQAVPGDVVLEVIQEVRKQLAQRKQKQPDAGLAALQAQLTQVASSLHDRGFDELPPAGFLPVSTESREAAEAGVRTLLKGVDVRFCTCRADHVGHELEAAQHRERIRLHDKSEQVDVLVPGHEYGWVAFVRRREAECAQPEEPEPTEEVTVTFFKTDGPDAYQQVVDNLTTGKPPGTQADWAAAVEYPPGGWRLPRGDAHQRLHAEIDGPGEVTVFIYATAEERRALAVVRATLLVGRFTDDDLGFTSRTRIRAGAEEIVVVKLVEAR